MKVSQRLYQAAQPIWENCCQHPFVQGMVRGTLSREKFRFYMIQDHKYLMNYAKVLALGVVRADRERDMRLFGTLIDGTLNAENEVHRKYLEELSVDQATVDAAPVCLTSEAYTSYMLSVAVKEGLAELAVVVLACAWSYLFVGDYMDSLPESRDEGNFYSQWIATYTDPVYRGHTEVLIDFVDRLTLGYTEEQLQNLERIITNCSYYEHRFWDMAWNQGESEHIK